jgi:tRNA-binding protein
MSTIEDFEKVDIRVGRIVQVDDFPEAKRPAYKLTIDFGSEIGIKHSAGRFTKHHSKPHLLGKKVLGVVNFPPRQIGPFISECLTLGVPDTEHEAVLIVPDNDEAVIGGRLY